MLRPLVLALGLSVSSGFVLTQVPARASVHMAEKKKANEDTPDENFSNTPGAKPNFAGGSFADYLKAQEEKKKKEAEGK